MLKQLAGLILAVSAFVLGGCGQGGVPSSSGGNAGYGSYLVSGSVGAGVSGVTDIVLSGASGVAIATTTSDAAGGYSFPLPAEGNYSVTPSNPAFVFSPASSSFSVTPTTTGRGNINFVANASYSLSGSISGGVMQGVDVVAYGAGGFSMSAQTDANGYYVFNHLANGNYTVIPSTQGLAFTPMNKVVQIAGADSVGNDFINTGAGRSANNTASISGALSGVVSSGATMLLYNNSTGASVSTVTDLNGFYAFTNLPSDSYTVIPSYAGYSFSPININVPLAGINSTANDFVSLAGSSAAGAFTIDGTISGAVTSGVTLNLHGTNSATPVQTVSDANGYFAFRNVAAGNYTIIPAKSGFGFSPANIVISLNSASSAGNSFLASVAANPTGKTISGAVSGAIVQGVNVLLYNATTGASVQAVTDANGFYAFANLSSDNYTIIPSSTGYSFSPANLNVTLGTTNSSGNNFSTTANLTQTTGFYSVNGTISGAVRQGVSVLLYGPTSTAPTQAITDANGYYIFNGLAAGDYTTIPSLAGYVFTPQNGVVTVTSSNISGNNFFASTSVSASPTYSLSGTISGDVVQGVTVNLYGSVNATTTTNANGYFTFSGLSSGSYTVIPNMPNTNFVPINRVVNITGASAAATDFNSVSIYHSISGGMTGGLAGVAISLTGPSAATVNTDATGSYVFNGLVNGAYTVIPSLAGYTFSPTQSVVNLNGLNATGINFTPTYIVIPTYAISGHITNRKGLAGNSVVLSGAANATTYTDANGYYQFLGLVAGTYTVTPTSAFTGISFAPSASTLSLTADTVVDFAGRDSIDVTISSNTNNFDARTALIAAGWDGASTIVSTIFVNTGVVVGSTSATSPALSIQGAFPAGSSIRLENRGQILGAGGAGGAGGVPTTGGAGGAGGIGGKYLSLPAIAEGSPGAAGGDTYASGANGQNGGVGLLLGGSLSIEIINHGTIEGGSGGAGGSPACGGGGGGGGGGAGASHVDIGGAGGAGGASCGVAGSGGTAGIAGGYAAPNNVVSGGTGGMGAPASAGSGGANGLSGGARAGATGGPATNGSPGNAGAASNPGYPASAYPGKAGGAGGPGGIAYGTPGQGGAAGAAVQGTANATWLTIGTIVGAQQ
ncbi:MAG: carboxypeptidase regulatory-like domain-containing protein [Halothiobacillaceae bacterium]|nr:carboxypeptidase regulatory-like domain-containing protein [Halothiobacillaceae bacterium]